MAITTKQLENRSRTIGSSDAPAIMGASPWADESKIRAQKLGLLEESDETSEKAVVGTLMEPVLRELLARKLDRRVVASTSTFVHPRYPFLTANLDAFVDECKRGNEIGEFKTSGLTEGWGEPETDEVPVPVVIQCQHQMAVTDAPLVRVVRMFPDGREWTPLHYCVPRDEKMIGTLVEYLVDWFERYVVAKEPLPQRERAPLYEIQTLIRRDETKTIEVAPDLFAAAYRATELRKKAEEDEKAAKARLLLALGEVGGGSCELGTFVLKTENAGLRVDAQLLKSEFPDVYAKVATPGTRKMPRWKLSPKGKETLID